MKALTDIWDSVRFRETRTELRDWAMVCMARRDERAEIGTELVFAVLDLLDRSEKVVRLANAYHTELVALQRERDGMPKIEAGGRTDRDGAQNESAYDRVIIESLIGALRECVSIAKNGHDYKKGQPNCEKCDAITRAEILLKQVGR